MSGKIFCPNPNCRMELEPYAEKCPYCGEEKLDRLFLTKEEYEKWKETHKWPAPRPSRPPAPSVSRPRYTPPPKPLPKARVFAGGRCMWILRENGKLYKLDNSGAQARKVLEDDINYDAAEGSDSFFYLTKDGKQKFWKNGTVSFWSEDGLQPSQLYSGEDFALLLTKSGELYQFDQEKRRRIATDVRSAAAGKTSAVYTTKDGGLISCSFGGAHSFVGRCDFSRIQDVQAVYANGCRDTFWLEAKDRLGEYQLFLCGDGSRNRPQDTCTLAVFSGTCYEDPDCRLTYDGGYDEDNSYCKELYDRFAKLYGGVSVTRHGEPVDYNQELPHCYAPFYTSSFEDRIELSGPVKWLRDPVPFDCGITFDSFTLRVNGEKFSRRSVKKVVRLTDGWGVLEVDGTLSLLARGKKRSTVQDVFDIAVTTEDTVILSKKNGEVLCGSAKKLLQSVHELRRAL